MKIAVYAIAKNEEQFVGRWLKSAIGADYILLADTGSTDQTIHKFSELGFAITTDCKVININVIPWRFDDARNAALAALPKDIDVCIALDLDEVLVHGWREIIEKRWEHNTDRLRYNYVWSWTATGEPGLTYHGDKIHSRDKFRWVGPVHETLVKNKLMAPEVQTFTDFTLIEHHPDNTKSRGQYMALLALAVKEDPYNDRNAHYYARDLLFSKHYEEAIVEFKRHLDLPTAVWKPERAASMRYLGDCYFALVDFDNALYWFNRAVDEAPDLREPWVARAQFHRFQGNWSYVLADCAKCLKIVTRPVSYINWDIAWSDWPERMYQEAIQNLKVDFE